MDGPGKCGFRDLSLKSAFEKQSHSLLPWSGPVNVTAAVLLFVAITVALFNSEDPVTGYGFLYVVPIVMLALQYGAPGAIVATVATFVAWMVWNLTGDEPVSLVGSLIRIVAIGGTAALVVAIDATQIRSTMRLSESDALLRAISENMPDALYVIDEDGRYGFVNEAAARLVGKTPDELIGARYVEQLPTETVTDLETLRPGATANPAVSGRVDRVSFPDGDRVFRSVTGPVYVKETGRQGIFVMSQDITTERRRETYNRIQQRIAERLVAGPAIGQLPPIVLDELVSVHEISWGAYWHRDEEGVFHCLTVRGENPEVAVGDRREGLEMPGPFRLSWREPRGDRGGPTALVPVGPDGVAMVAYCSPVDDTEEIARIFKPTILLLDGYVERTRLAKEAERTKNEFFGLVSHELRTPLTSIIGYAELLGETEALSEQAGRFVEVIERNARRELRLVQDLLLLVRLEGGSFVLEREATDLQALVEGSCDIVRPQADLAGVKIESTLDETGPLWIDPHRIGQAVDNLLTNAIKFSDAGTVVHVRLNAEGETATIEVEDEGMGVSPEELKRLFDRLFRTRSAVESQIQGTGLGLTIVKSVVEAHEGSVSVRSVEGQGTTFSIELPVQRPPKAEMSLAASGEENQ
jgi:PAS domain S-box-containing protein